MAREAARLAVDPTKALSVYEGYRFFSPIDLASLETRTQYICGYVADNIVGVIKFYRCANDGFTVIGEEDKTAGPSFLDVRYVDVHRLWQNLGVATALIRGFSMRLSRSEAVIVSPLTEEGKRANLLGKFQEHWKRAREDAYPSAG